MDGNELCYLPAHRLRALFRGREASPVELMEATIARAGAVEPAINAFGDIYFDEALAAAKASEERYMKGDARLLEGLPLAVKDVQRVKGKRTAQGSLILKDHVDDHSDPMIERLTQAGAIIHARTTTPEFALSGICNSRLWGNTLNPFNTDYGPGGSSGGSGASLAAGTTTLATGTDIGGSIRIPAACCGVVGYKPPHGRNPDGPPGNFDTYNHCGPLTRTVRDAALVQNVISGPHSLDHDSLRERVIIPDEPEPVGKYRVAWSMDFGYVPIDAEVRANTIRALEVFRAMGCEVEEVDLGWGPECDEAAITWYGCMHFGRQTIWHAEKHADLLTDYALATADYARKLTLDDMARSWDVVHKMYQSFGPVMETHDIFICPTNAIPAIRADHDPFDKDFHVDGRKVDAEFGWILTHQFNMLHNCPVMAVPSGFASTGVPTGIQIVGRTFDDLSVFRAASAYEAAVGGWFESAGERSAL
jgi:amidase